MNADNLVRTAGSVRREHRHHLNGHHSLVIWLTGLSGAGKSTLAHALEARLHALGWRSYVLDGDNVRHGLCADLGFSDQDRSENIRRIGEVAALMVDAGLVVLAAFISPFRADRERVRALLAPDEFIEVYCRCDLAVCESRDVKGLYKRARAGEVEAFTGISSPYEPPLAAELVLDTAHTSPQDCVERIMHYLVTHGRSPARPDHG